MNSTLATGFSAGWHTDGAGCVRTAQARRRARSIARRAAVHWESAWTEIFAEYVVVDAREANLLPGNLSFQSAAPLACAGTTIWSGIVRAELKPGEWLAIVDAGGGLGHLGVQMAKAQGLNVIGIDTQRYLLPRPRFVA